MRTEEEIREYLNTRRISPIDICHIYNFLHDMDLAREYYSNKRYFKTKKGSFSHFKVWFKKEVLSEVNN